MAQDNIKVIISADGKSYVKTLNNSARATNQWARTVTSQTKSAATTYNQELNKVEQRIDRFGNKVGNMSHLLAGFWSLNAISNGTAAAYDRVASMEDLRTQYAFLLGSESEAARQEQFLLELSGKHKKSVADLSGQYSDLLVIRRAGLVTDLQARDLMIGMSNAQSATRASAVQLSQSLYGVSQAITSPIVRMEEFNQVVEPLPGLINAMDEASGLGAGGMRRLVNDGKVTSAYFRDVLIKSFESYEGAALAMADTLSGTRASAARDYDLLVRKLEQPINESMKAVLQGTSEALQFFTRNAEETALLLGGVVTGSLIFYTVKMGAAGAMTVAGTLEKRRFIAASIAEAKQETITAAAAVAAANAKVAALTRQKGAALGAKVATKTLAAAEAQAAAATATHTAAANRLAVAQGTATRAGRGLLSVLGGPLGLAFTALSVGASFVAMGSDAEAASDSIDDVIDRLDRSLGKIKTLELKSLRTELETSEKAFEDFQKKVEILEFRSQGQSASAGLAADQAVEGRAKLLDLEDRIYDVKAKIKALEATPDEGTTPGTKSGTIAPPTLTNDGKDLTLLLQGIEAANTAVYASETARIQDIYSQRHQMIIANTSATGEAREKALRKNTAKYLNEYKSAQARDKSTRTQNIKSLAQLELNLTADASMKLKHEYARRNAEIVRLTKEGDSQRTTLLAASFSQYKTDLAAQQSDISASHRAWAASISNFAQPWAGAAGTMGQIFGNIATIMKEGNKSSFEEAKKWASAQAIINGALAATRALAEGGPYLGPILAGTIAGVTAVQIKKIHEQKYTPAAHGGLDYVGAEQTYLLQKGERVLSPTQNRDLTGYLAGEKGTQGGGEFIFNMNFYSMDPRGTMELFMGNKGTITNAVLSEFKRRNIRLKAA